MNPSRIIQRLALLILVLAITACGEAPIPSGPNVVRDLLDHLTAKNRTMTSAQWSVYLDNVRETSQGKAITGNGVVTNVADGIGTSGYTVFLDVGAQTGDVMLIDVPGDTALLLSKGEQLSFSGRIRGLITFPSLTISLDDAVIDQR